MKSQSRPPVVVILGHVDHGKTTLLDYIRKTNSAAREVGGITQSIGAFEVELPVKEYASNKITFIDTPGHEAFTKLRSRGADVADCAILIVDAVDSVMPQTKESLSHIKSAGIPFIVAVNKIDLPGANVERVKQDLMKEGVMFEKLGGDIPIIEISAKTGMGVKELLEMILFIASLKELTASLDSEVEAYIIESKKDKRGVVASVIIKNGVLKVGDETYALEKRAKIKALINDRGQSLTQVIPSTPFELLGFKDLPEVGVLLTKKPIAGSLVSKDTSEKSLELDVADLFQKEDKKTLRVIIKANSQGSLDAILGVIEKNERIETILAAVGEVSKSDIFLAKTTKAIVIGFATIVTKDAVDVAKREKVIIKTYSLIYQLLDELAEVSHLLQEKEVVEKLVKGEAQILATFIIEKEKIAGIKVIKGKINTGDEIELYRSDKKLGKAKVTSLKTRSRELTEIKKGMEGGMLFYPQLDFNIGDVVKSYSI